MYSPKIDETLIPKLYIICKEQKKPMTKFVNEVIKKEIHKYRLTDKDANPQGISIQKKVENSQK